MNIPINPVRLGSNTRFLRHLACSLILLCSSRAHATLYYVENSALKVTLDTSNAAITALDKAVPTKTWFQDPPLGFAALLISQDSTKITAKVQGPSGPQSKNYKIVITIGALNAKTFHLQVTPDDPPLTDPYPYITLPPYPFLFKGTNTTDDWYYVQNNGGEGTLWNINSETMAIRGLGGWASGQPWWGITNLTQAMMARLDSFVRIQNPTGAGDPSAYKIPLEIEYSLYPTSVYPMGGYVAMAKAYRDYLVPLQNPALEKLATRAGDNSDLFFLENGTYAYFWDDDQTTFDSLAGAMKAAGLDRMIAMFNLGGDGDEGRLTAYMLNCIAGIGGSPCTSPPWIGGMYRTPTPNLTKICPDIVDWVGKLLLGERSEAEILQANAEHLDQNGMPDPVYEWDQLDTAKWSEPQWNGDCPPMTPNCNPDAGLPFLAETYLDHLRVIYHDTLPQQLGPSFYHDMDHGGPYEEDIVANRDGRQKILDDTRSYTDTNHPSHFLAGSGEGVSAWWTVSHLDYWEGGMEESVYGDIDRHPIMDHGQDFADDQYPCDPGDPEYGNCGSTYPGPWSEQEEDCLDEQHRIPLLALQWHDYVAETWNWRNSTFVTADLSWKKDLFNILYCGMPMWHVTNTLWTAHKADYIASYWKLLPVREANGFAEMTKHGWLTTMDPSDRSVQYTDWDNENRVIVNFSDTNYYLYTDTDGILPDYGSANIPPHGYAMLPDPVSENCEPETGTPLGWTDTPGGVNWDYNTGPLEGLQSLRFVKNSSGRTRIDFGDRPEVWVYFKLRLNGSSGAKTIGGLAANGATINQLFQVDSSLKPNFAGAITNAAFALNTTYNVWLHYRKGTGSNGIVDIGFSNTGTRPTSGNNFKQLTIYTGTNNAGRLFLGPNATSNFDTIFDSIRVAHAEIGNVP